MKTLIFSVVLSIGIFAPILDAVESSINSQNVNRDPVEPKWHTLIEAYETNLSMIRNGLLESRATAHISHRDAMDLAIRALNDLLDRDDSSSVCDLLPIVEILQVNNTDESPSLIKSVANSQTKGTLNYIIDGVFSVRLEWEPDRIEDETLVKMLKFYAGNPAQSVEGSWQTNNTMLVLYGNKLVDLLATRALDRLGPFYKAVLDSRRDAGNYHDSDQNDIPVVNRLTPDQLNRYELAFSRLEALAATGVLPMAVAETKNQGGPDVISSTTAYSVVNKKQRNIMEVPILGNVHQKQLEWQNWATAALVLSAIGFIFIRCTILKKKKHDHPGNGEI